MTGAASVNSVSSWNLVKMGNSKRGNMTESLKLPYLRKLDKRGDIQVWVVDGSYVLLPANSP